MPSRFIVRTLSTVAVATLLLAGCDRREPRLELVDYVEHQLGNVATDRVLPVEGQSLDWLRSGWLVTEAAPGEPAHLEIGTRRASLTFFSPEGEATAVEVEATLNRRGKRDDGGKGRVRLTARCNGEPLSSRHTLQPGRHSYRFEIPAELARPGANRLELDLRPPGAGASQRRPSALAVHGIAFDHGDGRPPRRSGAERIKVRASDDRGRDPQVIELPAASRLDLVAEIPADSRLAGRLAVRPASDRSGPLEVRIELLDAAGIEHLLYRRASEEAFDDKLAVDLEPWAGELARLRIRFGGPRNGRLELRRVAIEAPPGTAPETASFPALLTEAGNSGGLTGSDVVIVLIDAARADAFPPHESAEVTPTAARLARLGTRFDATVAPSSWTGQSIPGIFTGLYPDSLGMESWGSRLPAAAPTLAELFQAAGYRTVLWTQHPFYRSQIELMRGFDEVHFGRNDDYDHLPTQEELLGDGTHPLFAFVHLLPPHAPYDPPEPFRGAFTDGYEGSVSPDLRTLNSFPSRRDPAELTAEDLAYIRGRYRENVAYADSLVGRVVERLEAAGRFDDALVALLSDHGEAFLEHGRFLHEWHAYAEYVRVPAVVKWPASTVGFRPVITRPISLVDLAPTLADAFALDPEARFQGRSLVGAVFGEPGPPPPVYAYTRGIADGRRPPRPKHRLEDGEWKIVVDRGEQLLRLYRASDPLDAVDLAAELPLRAQLLGQRARLQAAHNRKIRDSMEALATRELDPETVERLKALGYL